MSIAVTVPPNGRARLALDTYDGAAVGRVVHAGGRGLLYDAATRTTDEVVEASNDGAAVDLFLGHGVWDLEVEYYH